MSNFPKVESPFSAEILAAKVKKAASFLVSVPSVKAYADSQNSTYKTGTPIEQIAERIVKDRLAGMGVYEDEESHKILVENVKEGEARKVFCEMDEEPKIPVARFAAMWAVLKDGDPRVDQSQAPKVMSEVEKLASVLSKSNFGQWSDEALLNAYHPDCDYGIVEALEKRADHRKFIVFKDEANGVIDVNSSLRFLRERRRGRTIPATYKMGDVLKRLYAAGDFPSVIYHECPFHSNVLLFDGYCDECCHNWSAVPEEARQFARLVKDAGQAPTDGATLRQFINNSIQGVDEMAKDFPKVKLSFDERKAEGKLPSLRRRTASSNVVQEYQDPLCVKGRRS